MPDGAVLYEKTLDLSCKSNAEENQEERSFPSIRLAKIEMVDKAWAGPAAESRRGRCCFM